LAAGRPKDIDFIARIIAYQIVSQISVARLIGSCADEVLKSLLTERFTIAVGLTQTGDEHGGRLGSQTLCGELSGTARPNKVQVDKSNLRQARTLRYSAWLKKTYPSLSLQTN